MSRIFLSFLFNIFVVTSVAQQPAVAIVSTGKIISPLDTVHIVCSLPGTISVIDSKGREYKRMKVGPGASFTAGGAAGLQTVSRIDTKGKLIGQTFFDLQPATTINDEGKMHDLFNLLYKGMLEKESRGYGEIRHGDHVYRSFEFWDLDNNNVMNGMQYFMPYGNELTDFLRITQREDGMRSYSLQPPKVILLINTGMMK